MPVGVWDGARVRVCVCANSVTAAVSMCYMILGKAQTQRVYWENWGPGNQRSHSS